MARTRKPIQNQRSSAGRSGARQGDNKRTRPQRGGTGSTSDLPANKDVSAGHSAARAPKPGFKPGLRPSFAGAYFLFGRNSVEAALKNRKRECLRLIGTAKSLADEKILNIRSGLKTFEVENLEDIAAAVPEGAPHQGLLLEVRFLPGLHIADLKPREGQKNIILMLDQVTDPQNVGACLRSAAAFGARALITQDRNSPKESGTLARASAGGLEALPWLQVPNLSQALGQLRDMGYWHVGLDGGTQMSIKDVSLGENIVIVMGSEGSGLRPLVKKTCDVIAAIPTTGAVESLNVSNAAAIALYELSRD